MIDRAARAVIGHFPVVSQEAPLVALGNRSGFSGACLWRVGMAGQALCLRVWPEGGPSPTYLHKVHRLMDRARQAGLAYVPVVMRTPVGESWVEHASRLWDLTTWMPGVADFHALPSHARLAAACTALAQVHSAWLPAGSGEAPCPAVLRRLERLRQWEALIGSGWRPALGAAALDPVEPWAERAWQLLGRLVPRLYDRLVPWKARGLPVQACLCDVWHDHVLFEGEKVTGLIDYGSVKTDHVAVDLARLLGSLVGDDREMRAAGLEAYRRVWRLSDEEEALVSVLDETGTVLGAANWLRWLYHEGRQYQDREAVARRLAALVERMDK
jgi:Ser/Thr protein kinase RdoA (MazF antagonist)